MFRTFAKKFLPNPLDWHLKRLAKRGGKRILLGWNRGLGDIALGLYAIVQRIREIIPDAEITFVTRHNLFDGFSLLEGVKTIIDPHWKRGEPYKMDPSLKKAYDLVIEKPSPTDWVSWQLGKIVPKLKWNPIYDSLYERFDLPAQCVGVQVSAETQYGLWRNWPLEKWQELFDHLEKKKIPVLLFGFGETPKFPHENLIDLRGKTTLFELLSIIKHRVRALVLPDSGISSMVYYLDASFPVKQITLWADPNHGILKQGVPSPNPKLIHCPLVASNRDLSTLPVKTVLKAIGKTVLPILLAGGQGTRLGMKGPKGLFSIGGKTLFQWFCEKLPKGSSVAIMTSPLNHEETLAYFQQNRNFDLDIHFFQQEMLPLLDEEKKPTGQLGPNGNGSVFSSFLKSGLAELFAKRRVECVTVSYVDNLLSQPLDPRLIEDLEEIAVQCIPREEADKNMGVLVEREGKLEIVEYTELDASRKYKYAYSGQIAFDFSFFCKMGTLELPLHWVQKKMDGKTVWKGERFIFDCFQYAKKVSTILVDRKTHYAPIKSPESVEQFLNLVEKR